MSALEPLQQPTERITYLPEVMNWRGLWSASTQYYVHDVVVSPTNSDAYLTNRNTLGGVDPALSPAPSIWTNLSGVPPQSTAMSYKGVWSGTNAYEIGDVIQSPTNASSYVAQIAFAAGGLDPGAGVGVAGWGNLSGSLGAFDTLSYQSTWSGANAYNAGAVVESSADLRTYTATQQQPAGGADPATGAAGWRVMGAGVGQELAVTQIVGAPNVAPTGSLTIAPYTLQANGVYFVSLTVEATNAVALAADDQLTISIEGGPLNVGQQTVLGNVGGTPWAGNLGFGATFSGVVKAGNLNTLSATYEFFGTNLATYTLLATNALVVQRIA